MNLPAPNYTAEATKFRIGAGVLDFLIFIGFYFVFVFSFGEKVNDTTYQVRGPKALIPIVFWFLYFVVLEVLAKGSLGNKIMGLSVESLDGERLTIIQIFKRRICDVLDMWWCFGLLGFILIKNTMRNQRLGDIWAKTIVVRTRK